MIIISTTVSYNNSTIATLDNETQVLQTGGKWLTDNITITDAGGGGGNDFIITLTYNSTTELWEPNKTFTEIQTAYNNNDNIIVNGLDADDEPIQTSFGYSTINTLFWYDVAWNDYDNNSFCHDYYIFNANNGLSLEYRNSYTTPPNLQAKTNISPSTSSQTIQADSGYDGLSSVQINAMPSGTSGTPTATKGTVSNNSISITPSVTNTTGYITGGTKTGTAVTVNASELVSGTLTISSSGTKDVTNYASASVAAGTVTAPSSISGTSATVSTGTNTLTLTKTVSVTPNVTAAGYISSGTAGNSSVSLTANVTTQAATTYNTSTTDQTITSGRYLTGNQTIKAVTVSGLDASKILSGTTVKIGDANDDDRIANVSGTVTFSTVTVSSSSPSGGNNGDIWVKTS